MRLALYQPDIPQNTGTILRLCACLSVPLDIIEPCGFTFTMKELKRAAMDYAEFAEVTRHASWEAFLQRFEEPTGDTTSAQPQGRIVLLSTKSEMTYTDFSFSANDVLLLGRESSGVPQDVHERVNVRLRIPMRPQARSLNVAVASAMVLGEAMRQLGKK